VTGGRWSVASVLGWAVWAVGFVTATTFAASPGSAVWIDVVLGLLGGVGLLALLVRPSWVEVRRLRRKLCRTFWAASPKLRKRLAVAQVRAVQLQSQGLMKGATNDRDSDV